ncbi:MAG: bifunctional ornithine acetyltransferase/N-acetylglutamate synthase [Planctomycetia bacterium 21-64-5]|nr:MAG: bifunctional ornithine acetyltransferase/N-acetylglutamate synthase [Planctomycetia bacterium 21-64-5]
MNSIVPQGYRLAGVYAGVKRNAEALDLALIVSDRPATAAGVYTQNLVFAAPVKLDRARTPSRNIRAVVVNSGNANACTGARGDADAARMAELAAATCGATGEQALVLSTGVIGEFLPMEKISAGIAVAAGRLASDEASLVAAARGMMTTDTRPKLAGRTLHLADRTVQITGLAKGAAMIGPRMATMLSLILTDAALEPEVAQQALSAAVETSFNCISVDGHTSTNDTVLLLANGAAGTAPLDGSGIARFQEALDDACGELARAIPSDGEGATHLVTIDVRGCATREAAHRIAKTVAESPLVKTAIAGADPNWGRIVSAAGYAGIAFSPAGITLHVNGILLYRAGSPVAFDADRVSKSIRDQYETSILLEFGEGTAAVRFWTTDLTAEYVRLNADYHT